MYKDVLQILLDGEMSTLDIEPVTQAIEAMASKSYWQSKDKRLGCLIQSEDIAYILIQESLGFDYQIQELIGKIAPQISKNCSYTDAIRNASDVIEAAENIMYEIKIGSAIMINSFYKLNAETYAYIDLGKYEPPVLTEPNPWVQNDRGGYYLNDLHCVLGSTKNRHHKRQALDVLNKLQAISWELSPVILEYEEIPNKEFTSPMSHEQFKTMALSSKKTYQNYINRPFWFIWQFDKRGRQYSRGYHINLQSSGYKKALLNFSNKSLIEGAL